MPQWTDPQLVIDTWVGEGEPDDISLVSAWVDRAERLLRRKVPDLQVRLDAPEPDLLDTIHDVVTAMVQRVFRNPEGIRQKQETTGSFTGSLTFGGDNPGTLELLPSELSALTNGEAGQSRVGSISMIPLNSPFHPSNQGPPPGWW